jgi:hypothetical protein
VQRDALEFERDVEKRVVLDADLAQHLVAGLLHDLGARVAILVDPVAEAHQPEAVVLVLGAADVFRDARACRSRRACSAPPRWRRRAPAPQAAQPAAMQANGLAPEEPASRTVEVEAFCSWSACRMKMRSIARASTALGLYSYGTA